MSEFEKELDGILEIIKDEKFYDSKLYALPSIEELKAHFKDWQPPKPLVKVPQCVDDAIKALPKYYSVYSAINFIRDKVNENEHWLDVYEWIFRESNVNEFARVLLDGYTVEKEKKYILKHIDMSKLYTDVSLYLAHGFCKELEHVFYKDVNVHNTDECHFTQSEIDKLNIGSYEQIEVDP